MASYHWNALQKLFRSHEQFAERERDAGRAGEIAALPKARLARATVVQLDRASGVAVISQEVGLVVRPGQEVELRLEPHPEDLPVLSWTTLEVRTRSKSAPKSHVVVVSHPYSTDWMDLDAMRESGSKHHTRAQLQAVRREAIERGMGGPNGHVEYLRGLSFDVFETNGKWYTARPDQPRRIAERVGSEEPLTGRRPWNTRLVKLPEYRKGQTYRKVEESWIFGLCRSPHDCLDSLRRDERLRLLSAQALDGTLFERECAGTPPLRAEQIEPRARELAPKLLEAACEWSLAGPAEGLDADQGGDPRWRNAPLSALVERIFVRSLYALHRRVQRARIIEEESLLDLDAEHLEAALEVAEERLGMNQGEVDNAALLLQSTELLEPARRDLCLQGCVMVVALRRLVSSPDELPVQRLGELAVQEDPDISRAARWALDHVERWFDP